MTDRRIDLKNPWLAGLLAWLIPGCGHFYQQRHFKGALYLFCILGAYLFGLSLGEWRALYWTEPQGIELQEQYSRRTRNYSFLTQLGVGTPGLWAFFQSRRFYRPHNRPSYENPQQLLQYLQLSSTDEAGQQHPLPGSLPLEETLETEFRGHWHVGSSQHTVEGQIRLEPFNRTFRGHFDGSVVTPEGKKQPLKLELAGAFFLDRPVVGDPNRRLVVTGMSGEDRTEGVLSGSVSRNVFNWFAAPQTPTIRNDLHFRLNKQFEVALVFTWIAGLLNILAIWDAVQGPAYGFGDAAPEEKKQEPQNDEKDVAPENRDQASSQARQTPKQQTQQTEGTQTEGTQTEETESPTEKERSSSDLSETAPASGMLSGDPPTPVSAAPSQPVSTSTAEKTSTEPI